jgi:hypothetical protein
MANPIRINSYWHLARNACVGGLRDIDISLCTRWRMHIYIFIGSPVSLESVPREIEEERVEYGVQVCAYFWNLILVTESLIWYG